MYQKLLPPVNGVFRKFSSPCGETAKRQSRYGKRQPHLTQTAEPFDKTAVPFRETAVPSDTNGIAVRPNGRAIPPFPSRAPAAALQDDVMSAEHENAQALIFSSVASSSIL